MAGPKFNENIPLLTDNDFLSEPISGLTHLKENVDRMRCKMELFVTNLQAVIVRKFEEMEGGKKFLIDKWSRKEGGGGITCILNDGNVIEKGGVNISAITGTLTSQLVASMRSRGKEVHDDATNFFATGISSVIHPVNPHVPTMHFNYRYFETFGQDGTTQLWWFGGGVDHTPYYLHAEDHKLFHQVNKDACDKHDPTFHTRFKKWADDYFYIKHREECRGIGGLFFDDLDEKPIEECFNFIADAGHAVLPGYIPSIERWRDEEYGDEERNWQLIRRGRYVEFNLVYDRGTKFGLYTPGARIESILMSLPQTARWEYMHEPEEGSEERKVLEVLRKPIDWLE